MANSFKTSQHTELVALRAAESAGYLTVGSRKYLKEQLKGKRNGVKYDFVISDAGQYQEGIDLSATGPSDLVERKVTKEIFTGNVMIATNILEKVTDLNWDKEVAIPNGKKLVNGIVQSVINDDFGLQNTAFVGIGYGPLNKAGNFLASVSDEARFAFIDPMINSIVSLTGKAFSGVEGAEPMYKKGLLGELNGVEYRSQQFLPMVSVSKTLGESTASAITYVDNGDGTATITLTGVSTTIPKGFVIWVDGVYATDLVGDKTSQLKAFVAIEDGTNNGEMKVRAVEFIGEGNKEVCDANGDALGATKTAAITALNAMDKIVLLPEGNYFTGLFRLDGVEEFESLDTIDASNADTEMASNEGLNVFCNRASDVIKGSNVTRWSCSPIAGIVDPRGAALVLVKDVSDTVNPVSLV